MRPHDLTPYWVRLQRQQTCFNTTENTSYRSWTLLQRPHNKYSAVIDPTGMITPTHASWSLTGQLYYNHAWHQPDLSTKQTYTGDTITSVWSVGSLEITQSVTILTESDTQLRVRITLMNTGETTHAVQWATGVDPITVKGPGRIRQLCYLSTDTLMIDGKASLQAQVTPDSILCLSHRDSTDSICLDAYSHILQSQCEAAQARARLCYYYTLAPEQAVHSVYIITLGTVRARVADIPERSEKIIINTPDRDVNLVIASLMNDLPRSLQQPVVSGCFTTQCPPVYHDAIGLALLRMKQPYRPAYLTKTGLFGPPRRTLMPVIMHYYYAQVTGDATHLNIQWRYLNWRLAMLLRQLKQTPALPFLLLQTDTAALETHAMIIRALYYMADLATRFKLPVMRDYEHTAITLDAAIHDGIQFVFERRPDAPHLSLSLYPEYTFDLITSLMYPIYSATVPMTHAWVSQTLAYTDAFLTQDGVPYNTDKQHPGVSIAHASYLASSYAKRQNHTAAWRLINWLVSVSHITGVWPTSTHPLTGKGSSGHGHDYHAGACVHRLIHELIVCDATPFTLRLLSGIPPAWWMQDVSYYNAQTVFGELDIVLSHTQPGTKKFVLQLAYRLKTEPRKIIIIIPEYITEVRSNNAILPVHNQTVLATSNDTRITLVGV